VRRLSVTAALVLVTAGPALAQTVHPRIESLRPRIEPLVTRIADHRLKTETVETPRATVIAVSADVLFAFGSARVSPRGTPALRSVAERVARGPRTCLEVVGHTDARGPAAYNQRLSLLRARAVRTALRSLEPAAGCVRVAGRGERDPVTPNTRPDGSDSPRGRARNRRVEVRIER